MRGTRLIVGGAIASALLPLAACGTRRRPEAPPPPPRFEGLSRAEIGTLMKRRMKPVDTAAWARAVDDAMAELQMVPAAEPVCEVLAVIEQESGYRANPEVANLASIVKQGIEEHTSRFGPLGKPIVSRLLGARAAGQKATFAERFERARTERDVDTTFRDLVAYYEESYPKSTRAADLVSGALFGRELSDFNPITTAGSMQVSVRFAVERAARRGSPGEARVRDELYTVPGGVRYGVARLLGYQSSYERALYRFADYNAGVYASRNAAIQEQLGALTGIKLALDGDLLIYDDDGSPSSRDSHTLRAFLALAERQSGIGEGRVRKDLRLEKTLDFEGTETYLALKQSYRALVGKTPAYARIPQVMLESPKITKSLTTEWFARSVDRRYQDCLARARALKRPSDR